ncbi:lipoyl synthase [Babesia caballi]|uniref:Lipoyl synthase n=1 Tax=Babesia caballi TaxID=5871 RepID=A0AAV4LQB5_BABCB|nr:lipoyl synthase [Babesia caballi]
MVSCCGAGIIHEQKAAAVEGKLSLTLKERKQLFQARHELVNDAAGERSVPYLAEKKGKGSDQSRAVLDGAYHPVVEVGHPLVDAVPAKEPRHVEAVRLARPLLSLQLLLQNLLGVGKVVAVETRAHLEVHDAGLAHAVQCVAQSDGVGVRTFQIPARKHAARVDAGALNHEIDELLDNIYSPVQLGWSLGSLRLAGTAPHGARPDQVGHEPHA